MNTPDDDDLIEDDNYPSVILENIEREVAEIGLLAQSLDQFCTAPNSELEGLLERVLEQQAILVSVNLGEDLERLLGNQTRGISEALFREAYGFVVLFVGNLILLALILWRVW